MGGQGGADNFSNDFMDAIGEANNPENVREMPPLHPGAKGGFQDGQWRDIAKEMGADMPGAATGNDQTSQLFTQPKGKFKARFGRFNLGEASDCAELEKIQNNCLTPGKNWILAREEWYNTKDGDVYVVVKYLEFFPTRKTPEAKEEAEGTGSARKG